MLASVEFRLCSPLSSLSLCSLSYMGNTNTVPVISQTKSLVQFITGDKDGARDTQEKFLHECPIVAQATSIVELVADKNKKKFKDTNMRTVRILSNVADGIPVVGHVKGAIHAATGDFPGARNAIKSANRSVGVVSGGVVGFLTLGPLGAVAGGIAGGAALDGIQTGVESAIYREFRPNGSIAAVRRVIIHPSGGAVFDAIALPIFDGLGGFSAGKLAAQIQSGIASALPPPDSSAASSSSSGHGTAVTSDGGASGGAATSTGHASQPSSAAPSSASSSSTHGTATSASASPAASSATPASSSAPGASSTAPAASSTAAAPSATPAASSASGVSSAAPTASSTSVATSATPAASSTSAAPAASSASGASSATPAASSTSAAPAASSTSAASSATPAASSTSAAPAASSTSAASSATPAASSASGTSSVAPASSSTSAAPAASSTSAAPSATPTASSTSAASSATPAASSTSAAPSATPAANAATPVTSSSSSAAAGSSASSSSHGAVGSQSAGSAATGGHSTAASTSTVHTSSSAGSTSASQSSHGGTATASGSSAPSTGNHSIFHHRPGSVIIADMKNLAADVKDALQQLEGIHVEHKLEFDIVQSTLDPSGQIGVHIPDILQPLLPALKWTTVSTNVQQLELIYEQLQVVFSLVENFDATPEKYPKQIDAEAPDHSLAFKMILYEILRFIGPSQSRRQKILEKTEKLRDRVYALIHSKDEEQDLSSLFEKRENTLHCVHWNMAGISAPLLEHLGLVWYLVLDSPDVLLLSQVEASDYLITGLTRILGYKFLKFPSSSIIDDPLPGSALLFRPREHFMCVGAGSDGEINVMEGSGCEIVWANFVHLQTSKHFRLASLQYADAPTQIVTDTMAALSADQSTIFACSSISPIAMEIQEAGFQLASSPLPPTANSASSLKRFSTTISQSMRRKKKFEQVEEGILTRAGDSRHVRAHFPQHRMGRKRSAADPLYLPIPFSVGEDLNPSRVPCTSKHCFYGCS